MHKNVLDLTDFPALCEEYEVVDHEEGDSGNWFEPAYGNNIKIKIKQVFLEVLTEIVPNVGDNVRLAGSGEYKNSNLINFDGVGVITKLNNLGAEGDFTGYELRIGNLYHEFTTHKPAQSFSGREQCVKY